MKKYFIIIIFILSVTNLNAQDNLRFYIDKALMNNLKLNAERQNFNSAKQSKNIFVNTDFSNDFSNNAKRSLLHKLLIIINFFVEINILYSN